MLIFGRFQSFEFFFDKLAPLPRIYVSKDALNHFLVHSSAKAVSEVLKTWYFSYSAFWSTGHGRGGGYSTRPSGNATVQYWPFYYGFLQFLNFCAINQILLVNSAETCRNTLLEWFVIHYA